jgi:hypothetical protein
MGVPFPVSSEIAVVGVFGAFPASVADPLHRFCTVSDYGTVIETVG